MDSRESGGGEHLLLVEDDPILARGLARNLELEGFRVTVCHTGEEGLEQLRSPSAPYALVVLDVMLPGIDGLEVCRRLRAAGNAVPVLFLTARGGEADRVMGLRLGADDYLPKPFSFEELVLRIRALLRRSGAAPSGTQALGLLEFGDNSIDLEALEARTPAGTLRLTEREAVLLRYLAENADRVIPRGELLERVWGYAHDTETRTLDTFMHRLRRYFEKDPQHPRHFHTVRGIGYRFTPETEEH